MNNAIWCQSVCRAHGTPSEIVESHWWCPHRVPPFYSNLVALTAERQDARILDRIGSLFQVPLSAQWSVKDSFDCLDLTELGFRELFRATWIWRDASSPMMPSVDRSFEIASDAASLAAWERCWRSDPGNAGAQQGRSQFPDSLLDDPDFAFITCRDASGRVVGGAAANRTDDVVGVSNVFSFGDGPRDVWQVAIQAVSSRWPGLALVGYERGADLETATSFGFQQLGPLKVWIRSA